MKSNPKFVVPPSIGDPGLTLRDYYAGLALQGILAQRGTESLIEELGIYEK